MRKSDERPNDIFAECTKNAEKFFNEVDKIMPLYHQTATDVQKRYLEAWKKVIEESITLQKEFAIKSGVTFDTNEEARKAIENMTEYAISAYQNQNKMALKSFETPQKIFDVFNENSKTFASLNKNMIEFMSSVMRPRVKS